MKANAKGTVRRIARHSRLSHALEQTITNVLYAILVGGICVVLFS